MSDSHSAESVSARYVSLGKGKYHILPGESEMTVCGREVEFPAATTVYKPSVCTRCAKGAPDLLEAAEQERKALWERANTARTDKLTANREGRFTVYRCRKCGTQHRDNSPASGVPFCITANHMADLEEVEAVGPIWAGESP